MVKVKCYDRITTFNTRREAMSFYKECAEMSEGSERERYMNIILDLMDGKEYCTDGVN